MNTIFDAAIIIVLQHEGGLSNDPHDPGGLTNFGISTRFVKDNELDINIAELTAPEAENIYYEYFWIPNHFDLLTLEVTAVKIFDTLVNIGSYKAISIAQKILEVPQDGILGPVTAEAINWCVYETFLEQYRALQAEYYQLLVSKNPGLASFLNGWLKRAAS